MTNEIVNIAETVMRKLGGAVNLALVAGFVFATLYFKDMGISYFAAAGGMPILSRESIITLAQDPEISRRMAYWAGAWFCAVAAMGSGLMAVLGLRWSFHAALRTLNSLKV